jgi:hypothetical protein
MGWIWNKDPDYRGCDSGNKDYSTKNEVDNVRHASKNVAGQNRSETGREG